MPGLHWHAMFIPGAAATERRNQSMQMPSRQSCMWVVAAVAWGMELAGATVTEQGADGWGVSFPDGAFGRLTPGSCTVEHHRPEATDALPR